MCKGLGGNVQSEGDKRTDGHRHNVNLHVGTILINRPHISNLQLKCLDLKSHNSIFADLTVVK